MILIFSKSGDYTTFEVMRWINHLNQDAAMVRVNSDDMDGVTHVSLSRDHAQIHAPDHRYELDEVDSVWYRKGVNHYQFSSEPKVESNDALNQEFKKITVREAGRVTQYFHKLLEDREMVLGAHARGNLNKSMILFSAAACGLSSPDFIISNRKSDFLAFLKKHKDCITKSISDGLYLFDGDQTGKGYFNYTSRLTESDLADYDEHMPLSFAQAMVDKKFEIRTFYIRGECYSVAIFSQRDDQTRVDYRRYNLDTPNRTVPFNLPEEVRLKLVNLFDMLDLNTGSVDFIVDQDGAYQFLEINPVGLFGAHSLHCNYRLEKRVAEVILNEQ